MAYKEDSLDLLIEINPTTIANPIIGEVIRGVWDKKHWIKDSGGVVTYGDPAQITITTTVSITTDTLGDSGKTQKEKNVIISNGVNAINITVNGGTDFLASYVKHGTGTITFVQGSGRTLINVNATAILNGAVGSTATISSIGTTDYLRISNA